MTLAKLLRPETILALLTVLALIRPPFRIESMPSVTTIEGMRR